MALIRLKVFQSESLSSNGFEKLTADASILLELPDDS